MKNEESPEALIASLARGDLSILDEIYDRYRNDFLKWGTAHYAAAKRDDLLDAWQDAVIMFYEQVRDGKLKQLTCQLRTFLFLIASRRLAKLLKKTERIELTEEFDVKVSIIESINELDEPEDEEEKKQLLREGVATLPPQSRQALVLRYVEGKSIAEIKQIMNYGSENVVSATLSRTLKKLKDSILEKTASPPVWKKENKS
jgi:RNA polymerase sigma factor (sigma-70 family)